MAHPVSAPSHAKLEHPPFDLERLRADFPVLEQEVHGHSLAYLDNAASAQKPRQVVAALDRCYLERYSNVHRGVHFLSAQATEDYEEARRKVQRFLHAASARELVFVRGTTEAINLVAASFVAPRLEPGDEVLITALEHHSNIVPWQLVCEPRGARLVVAPIDEHGQVVVEEYARLLSPRTKIAAIAHVSNALGTVNPVAEMVALAHEKGVPVLIDGAQAVPHREVDVQALGCDFYAFSGHKLFGPTGIGVLYGKAEHLEAMPPYQGGGEMIRRVTFERTTYAPPPARFEAGTPHIAGAVGLGAAIDYVSALDREATAAWEASLLAAASEKVGAFPGVRLIGTAEHKSGVLSFVIDGVHAHDVGTVLDRLGIAVRVGHHCAQPVMDFFSVPATVRASFAFYNTMEEVDRLVAGIGEVGKIFG